VTALDLDASVARAGRIDCACGSLPGGVGIEVDTWRLSVAFGLAIFAQALLLTVVPVAGFYLSPRPSLVTLPFALIFAGAACASVPTSLLLDQFGRRAAFAIGASLGAAGGALAAWAIATRHFPELCIGAFWLGVAQGFALFYRHAAAIAHAGGSRAALVVLLGGLAGGILVPCAIVLCKAAFGPLVDAVLPALAGFANILALPLIVTLPHKIAEDQKESRLNELDLAFWLSTLVGAAGWFAMAHAMMRAPSQLIGCGMGVTFVGAAEAWHLIVMYAPMAIASRWSGAISTRFALTAGVALASLSIALSQMALVEIMASLSMAGLGWSLIQIGVGRLLYDRGHRSKIALGAYDGINLGAALAGVLSV
jgi:MFS family permease